MTQINLTLKQATLAVACISAIRETCDGIDGHNHSEVQALLGDVQSLIGNAERHQQGRDNAAAHLAELVKEAALYRDNPEHESEDGQPICEAWNERPLNALIRSD